MPSSLLTPERVEKAMKMIRGTFVGLMDSRQVKRRALHIVVLDPTALFSSGLTFEAVILLEHSFFKEQWEEPFNEFARAKAKLSWRTGLDSHAVQQRCPHLYGSGDIKYGGSVVRDGLIVAASGVEWYFDQMFAEWVASACKAQCIKAMEDVLTQTLVHHLP